jgi:hypothetical protein
VPSLGGQAKSQEEIIDSASTTTMATDTPPSKKSRRIIDDDDDDDDLPDITDPEFLKAPKAATPRPAKEESDDDAVAEGLFSDGEDASEKEESRSPRKKRYTILAVGY